MRQAFNASTIPSIEGLDADQAERAFIAAGWSPLKNDDGDDPGHNSHVLFSPDGRQVARIATGDDPGFEAFADFCDGNPSPHLPVFEVNRKSDTGVHLTVTERLKWHNPDDANANPDAKRQVDAVQDLIWNRPGEGTKLDPALVKTLKDMLDAAAEAHARDPGIYEGIDFAGDDPKNFLYRELPGGGVQLVLTDGFARNGPPDQPDWNDLRNRLAAMTAPPALPRPLIVKSLPVLDLPGAQRL